MNYYRRYMGDYARDTAHLSAAENGVYNFLLDTYYATERPLPNDDAYLYRLGRARDAADRATVLAVANEFFPVGQDGLRHNARADREIEAAQPRIRAARENGRKHVSQQEPTGIPLGSHREPGVVVGGSLELKTQQAAEKAALAALGERFTIFWQAYPKKVSRPTAVRAWIKLKPDDALTAKIVAGVVRAKQSEQWSRDNGAFIPHPATFLNGRRWEDETSPVPPTPTRSTKVAL